MTAELAQQYLDRLCEELPEEIFTRLNGGVVLSEHFKHHPDEPDMLIMGEYCNYPGTLGRYVIVYYAAIASVCETEDAFLDKLKEVLHHELTHHLESLAGERDLEKEDARQLRDYRDSKE